MRESREVLFFGLELKRRVLSGLDVSEAELAILLAIRLGGIMTPKALVRRWRSFLSEEGDSPGALRSVQQILRRLAERGLVKRERMTGPGGAYVYALHPETHRSLGSLIGGPLTPDFVEGAQRAMAGQTLVPFAKLVKPLESLFAEDNPHAGELMDAVMERMAVAMGRSPAAPGTDTEKPPAGDG